MLKHFETMRKSDSDYLTGLIFTCWQVNGKSLMKTLRLREIVVELSQYISSQISI